MWRRCAAAVLGLVLAASAVLAQADEPGKWRTILDPSTRDGWEQVGYGSFVLEDGALKTEGGMGLLWYTKEKLGNCRIRVVYKAESETANSGVFVRIGQRPRDAWEGVHKGYEVQICDAADELHRTGAVYSMAKAPASPAKPGEWNTLEIELRGE